ncbi:MAG TPA: hypothetical protein VKT73_13200 [Xanthobacteraceae bacterium]|nr:hypothetical protein [Xanthobacteraceae bacterium]
MKIAINRNLSDKVASAEEAVNAHFNGFGMARTHTDEAHRRKRIEAQDFLAGANKAPVLLSEESRRTGIAVELLAKAIIKKPDEFAGREHARRALIEKIRAAKSGREIDSLLQAANIGRANGVR